MTCYYPRSAYPIEGGITFEKPSGHSGNFIKIPCKRCVGCRLDHRTDWATRMMHEASLFESNHFLTLTYSPENLPEHGDLTPRDVTLFWKKLRNRFPLQKIRYVAAGEYGESLSRPHYHAIAFGLQLPDLEGHGKNDRGEILYKSELLNKIWGLGHCVVGDVTYQSCGYVAGYMLKDIKSDYANDGSYQHFNQNTGELTSRLKPFARYSNRPGIGLHWFKKYYKDVFPADCVRTLDGEIRPVPDYYFRKLEEIDPELHARVKQKRETAIWEPKNRWNSTPDRLAVRETVKLAKIGLAKRGSPKTKENRIFVTKKEAKK